MIHTVLIKNEVVGTLLLPLNECYQDIVDVSQVRGKTVIVCLNGISLSQQIWHLSLRILGLLNFKNDHSCLMANMLSMLYFIFLVTEKVFYQST